MPVHRNVISGACAAGLALALAACGGGGGGGGGLTPEEVAAAKAVAAAVGAARATGTDGGFDDTAHGVAPSVTAANDGTTITIGVTESGTPRGGSARSGDFAEQEDAPAAIAGWAGARFQRSTTKESLVVHTDVGVPEAMAFIPENLNKLDEVSGLTGETVPASGLTILDAWLPVVRSTSLAPAPANGSITHSAGKGTDARLEFAGTFGGGAGTYRCTNGAGVTCSVTLDDRGVPAAMGGTSWVFVPDSGAMVQVPDYDHLYFGWWLDANEGGAWGFQTFAGAERFPAGAGNVTAAMEGTATYRGAAAGVWAKMDVSGGQVTTASSGEFTAEAVLTASFFGALDAGVVNGEIVSFRNGSGGPLDGWRANLNAAKLKAGEASFAGGVGGTVGAGTSGEGSWEGRFHGTDGAATNARPSHVTGRFDLHLPGVSVAGAFGAGR